MTSLGEELPKLISQVRDEVLPRYIEVAKVAPLTNLTIAMIRAELDLAVKALAEGDVVQCVRSYKSLKDTYDS